MKTYAPMPDEKLIQYYLSNQPAALATLADLYKDRIYTVIFTMVPDREIAGELFAQVFVRIINYLMIGRVPEDNNYLPWAIAIAKQVCQEYISTPPMPVITLSKIPVDKPVPDMPSHIDPARYFESHGKLKAMIDCLPEEQRQVLLLNHYAGLSLKDIADKMKCTLTGALETMKTGLGTLRKLMMEKEMSLQ